jgi:hypothetical protein
MFSVISLFDGGPGGVGYYVLTPEGALSKVFDCPKDAEICCALLNLSLNATPIEE